MPKGVQYEYENKQTVYGASAKIEKIVYIEPDPVQL